MENKENEVEVIKDELKRMLDMIKNNHKAVRDEIEDVRESRSDEAITSWFSDTGDSLDMIRENINKLKQNMNSVKSLITVKDLKELKDKSGVTLKELASFVGYDTEQLSAISQLMSGKINDDSKKLRLYCYMLMKVSNSIEKVAA